MSELLLLGTKTRWGTVAAVGCSSGAIPERYYWLIDGYGVVHMLPSDVVEGQEDGDAD